MDPVIDPARIRTDDIAQAVTRDVIARLMAMDRQHLEGLRELVSERFGQTHRDLQQHGTILEAMRLQIAALQQQSALNGRDLEFLKSTVGKLDADIHGSGGLVPRVRELEKNQSRDAPAIAGIRQIVMFVISGLIGAALAWFARGGMS